MEDLCLQPCISCLGLADNASRLYGIEALRPAVHLGMPLKKREKLVMYLGQATALSPAQLSDAANSIQSTHGCLPLQ